MYLCMNEMSMARHGDLLTHIAACARQGITRMEIRKASLLDYLRQGGSLEQLKQTLARYGVLPVCLNSIESISFNGKRGMRVLNELSEYLFFCCRAIGCDCVEVIGSFKAPTDNEDEIREETVQALLQLSDTAAPYGIRLALEYMGVPASSVKTFDQALTIVNEVNRDNVGILLDTWHHYAGGGTPEGILRARGEQIFIVHTSDCPACAPLQAQRPQSYLPGDGASDIFGMLSAVKRIGYTGPVSVEVMDPALQDLPTDRLLELAKQTTQPLLDRLQ